VEELARLGLLRDGQRSLETGPGRRELLERPVRGAETGQRGGQIEPIADVLEGLDAPARGLERRPVLAGPGVRAPDVAQGDPLLAGRPPLHEDLQRRTEEAERLPVVPELQVDVPDVVEDAPVLPLPRLP